MDTHYIGGGSLRSTHEGTGREANTELRVEPSDGRGDTHLDLGIYGYTSGNGIRTVHLTREHAAELRDALNEWLS